MPRCQEGAGVDPLRNQDSTQCGRIGASAAPAVVWRVADGYGSASHATVNGYQCSRCASEDLSLCRAIHAGGTTTIRTRTTSDSVHTSPGGHFGTSVSEHETTGFAQTELAAACAPPRPPSFEQLVIGVAAFPVAAIGYLMLGFKWRGDLTDLLVVGFAGYLLVVGVTSGAREWTRAADYRSRLAAYERSCICLRCGARMLLPEGWDS